MFGVPPPASKVDAFTNGNGKVVAVSFAKLNAAGNVRAVTLKIPSWPVAACNLKEAPHTASVVVVTHSETCTAGPLVE